MHESKSKSHFPNYESTLNRGPICRSYGDDKNIPEEP